MARKFTDPGASNYFDYGRKTDSTEQRPVSQQMPADKFSLKDNVAKTQKQMAKKYETATDRAKKAALFTEGFSSGFAEKIASLKKTDQEDLLAKLYTIGTFAKRAADDQIPKPITQTASKQISTLGKQPSMLGKTFPPSPDGKPHKDLTSTVQAANLTPDQTPLLSRLPSFTPKLGILQRNPRDFSR